VQFSPSKVQKTAHFAKQCRDNSYLGESDRGLANDKWLEKLAAFGHLFATHVNTMCSYGSIRLLAVLVGLGLPAANNLAQTTAGSESPAPSMADGARPSTGAGVDSRIPALASQYTLGAADIIHVNVWKSADLSQTVTVGPDGFVSLPLLGDVHAAGLTANQLAQDLSSRLGSYVVNAQVTVSVVDIRSRQVFVTGQVGKPGAYSLIAPLTVLQLIAQAGGLNTFANRKGIFVLRGTKAEMQRLKFNYTNAIRGDVKQNIVLQPGDTVIIP
jgi:polysaccharide biosynthesis/export protein